MLDVYLRDGAERTVAPFDYSMVKPHYFWHLEVRNSSSADAENVVANIKSATGPNGAIAIGRAGPVKWRGGPRAPRTITANSSAAIDAHICRHNPPRRLVVFGNGSDNGNRGKLELRQPGRYTICFEFSYSVDGRPKNDSFCYQLDVQ